MRGRWRGVLGMALSTAAVAAAVTAGGGAVAAPSDPAVAPNPRQVPPDRGNGGEAFDRGRDKEQRRQDRRRTREARQARRESRSRHRNRGDSEALNTGQRQFPDALAGEPFTGSRLNPGQEIERYLNDNAAIVTDQQGRRTMLNGTLPLRGERDDGTKAAIDTTLRDDGGTLEPESTLTPVAVGRTLRDGVAMGERSELEMRLVAAGGNPVDCPIFCV